MERDLTISFLRSKQMLAVYRGVAYDTERKSQNYVAVVKKATKYRGIETVITFLKELTK